MPQYQTAAMHRRIAEQLERVARGEIDRLIIATPPRHGKTELAAKRYVAWHLGQNPHHHVIAASASFSLAEDHGRATRNIIGAPEYQQIFSTTLAEDSQARGHWITSESGSFFAVGIGGHLFGRGCHVLIVDDAFGSAADARSEQTRKNVHDWYSSIYSRLEPGGRIIVIASRLHEDDLIGRLLAQQAAGRDRWTIIEMKALPDDGKPPWPERFDVAALERIRSNISSKDWSALYQQSPIIEEGGFFKEEWIKPIIWPHGAPPPFIRTYGASDLAMTAGGGDFTVHIVIGIDAESRMHLLDMWRKQAAPKEWVEAQCEMIKRWKPAWWVHERVHVVAGIGPYLETRMRERQAYCTQELFVARHDKAIRSQSIRGRMELNGLYVRADAPWLSDFKAEVCAFPDASHDDIVDALGLAGQLMDKWAPGVVPPKRITEFVDKAYKPHDLSELRPPSFLTL
jgi:predicted phage terminase large subunit-like protein